ncbi:hypothetical protein [Ideonella sp.]|uniref:hypothetical protein n=1 Tax=Ideonella sp. TaxID=1929293 RepID=UPI0035AF5DE3
MSKPLSRAAGAAARRHFHAGLAGALLGAGAAPVLAAHPQARVGAPVARGRFGLTADFQLPRPAHLHVVPFDRTLYSEGADWALQPDGMLRIQTTGLYRVALCLDWVAQQGTDVDLRLYGIRRKVVGGPPGASQKDDRLASVSVPGSDAPRLARFRGSWTPGRVPAGATVALEVAVAPAGTVSVGDAVVASHTALQDAIVGQAAADVLSVRGRVVAPDRVRVVLHNTGLQADVDVPAGELRVMAINMTHSSGDSADAWHVVHTPLEALNAGELVYAMARNRSIAGDMVQASATSFLHIERHA